LQQKIPTLPPQNIKRKIMLDFSKMILEKVSFDKTLFRKELMKAIKWIEPNEKAQLRAWCLNTFGDEFSSEILEVFDSVAGQNSESGTSRYDHIFYFDQNKVKGHLSGR
jgi:hypothetical protein